MRRDRRVILSDTGNFPTDLYMSSGLIETLGRDHALRLVEPEAVEAAIDGAGPLRRFWTIVFPLLSPTTFFLIVVNVVYAFFETFGIIHTITKGGPGKATEILVYKVYADGFVGQDLGSSAAQSVVLMAIVIGLTVIQFR